MRDFGLSQTDLAESVGRSPQLINKILHGKRKISRDLAARLTEAFNVGLDWAHRGKGEPLYTKTIDRGRAHEQFVTPTPLIYRCPEDEDGTLISAREATVSGPHRTELHVLPIVDDEAMMHMEIPEGSVRGFCAVPKNLFPEGGRLRAFQMPDDGMRPVLPAGGIAIVERITERSVQLGDLDGRLVCAYMPEEYGDRITVRRCQLSSHHIFLMAMQRGSGPNIVPLPLPKAQGHLIGIVVWTVNDCRLDNPPLWPAWRTGETKDH